MKKLLTSSELPPTSELVFEPQLHQSLRLRSAMMRSFAFLLVLWLVVAHYSGSFARSVPNYPDLYEASIEELQHGLDSGLYTSVDLVKVCIYPGLTISYEPPAYVRLRPTPYLARPT